MGLPSPGPSPHSCAFEVRENEGERERGSVVASINPTVYPCLCATTGGLNVCPPLQIFGLIYGVFLNLPIHFNAVWEGHWSPPAHVISPTNAERHTNTQVSLNLCMCAPTICTSLASHWCTHANWTHTRSQPVFGYCYKLLKHCSSQCLHSVTQIYLAEAQWSSNRNEI